MPDKVKIKVDGVKMFDSVEIMWHKQKCCK